MPAPRDALSADTRLRITEIFYSLQGETRTAGLPTVFIRLTGCPLRCVWCDTAYAFKGGDWWHIDAILAAVAAYPTPHVSVTGGEPLAQKGCLALLRRLCAAGYTVSLETSGALDVSGVDVRVVKVMDIKAPGSGEASRNRYENIVCLQHHDQVKFVLMDRADYDWACALLDEYGLAARCDILFSCVQGHLEARELAEWILDDHLPVRLQIQLHKLLWGDQPGR